MTLEPEAEEPLSPIEQLRSVFDLCDKDSDGLLTVSEFRTLSQQFLGTETQQAEKLIRELDPQETGVIDFDNFRKGIQSYLLARKDSTSSSLSGSCLSLNGFSDTEPIMTSSPTGADSAVHDIHHAHTTDTTSRRSLSYHHQFNNNNASELDVELTANGTEEEDNDPLMYHREPESRRLVSAGSLSTLDVQPSGVSPMMVARSLTKRNNSNHSYLHVSATNTTTTGSTSYDSTPDWTIDDEHDELTDKLQELSSRLEGLEVDLDSSHTQTLHLKRENTSLRDRIETFEERVRELQLENESIEKKYTETLKQTKIQLKRKHDEELDELHAELQATLDKIKSLESANTVLHSSLDESKLECERRREESSELRVHIADLEDNLKHSKDLFKMERDRWKKEQMGSQQEVEAMGHVIEHLRKELVDGKANKKRQALTNYDLKTSEIAALRKEIKNLEEANQRLSSQLLQQGKQLVAEQPKSLLEELEDAPRNEILQALKEQEEHNTRLKMYIEGLLVTILEKHPELLEVK